MIEYASDQIFSPLALAVLTLEQNPEGTTAGPPEGVESVFAGLLSDGGDLSQQLRTHLTILVCDAALDAYRSAEMDLEHAVRLVRRVSAGSGREERIRILGELALRATEGPQPKQSEIDCGNKSRPPNPEWLQKLAVDLVVSLREADHYFAEISAKDAQIYVAEILFRLGLSPKFLSEHTLRRWCQERQRAAGKAARRGRPRKKE